MSDVSCLVKKKTTGGPMPNVEVEAGEDVIIEK